MPGGHSLEYCHHLAVSAIFFRERHQRFFAEWIVRAFQCTRNIFGARFVGMTVILCVSGTLSHIASLSEADE
jgi:hypothetical protein